MQKLQLRAQGFTVERWRFGWRNKATRNGFIAGHRFRKKEFTPAMRPEFDFGVWATYGLGPSRRAFKIARFQVAEKMLIALPPALQHVALVVVDGPFTAFDPYGSSSRSLFGSAKNTNHRTTIDPDEPVPEPYAGILNEPEFRPVPFTRFEAMGQDCCLDGKVVSAVKPARLVCERIAGHG